MPAQYKRKREKGYDQENLVQALKVLRETGASINSVAKAYKIPEATLRRHKGKTVEELPVNGGRFKDTFSPVDLQKLFEYVKEINERAFGLTRKEFGELVFNYAEGKNIPHSFNRDKKSAGKDWILHFMRRFSLTLRTPEQTSIARLSAFNKVTVGNFFDVLAQVLSKNIYSPSQIYNVDETGISTVPTKQPKVISPIGLSRVAKISSAERGVLVTTVCCISAAGQYVPPFFIFPRVRTKESYMRGAPPASAGVASESGWMKKDLFVKYLQHFVKQVRPSEAFPILLIMDNHGSHVSLESVTYCRENHITMLGIPPHTSGHLQPLDVGVYAPLKVVYSSACSSFMTGNPGRLISIKNITQIFTKAYEKIATVKNATGSFKATGICPFDRNIFSDEDFKAALTTERDEPTNTSSNISSLNMSNSSQASTRIVQPPNDPTQPPTDTTPTPPDTSQLLPNAQQPIDLPSTSGVQPTKEKSPESPDQNLGKNLVTSTPLPPMPKAERSNKQTRKKKFSSMIFSSTPVKDELVRLQKEKEEKLRKQKERAEKRIQKRKEKEEKQKEKEQKIKNKKKKPLDKKVSKKRKQPPTPSSSEESEVENVNVPYMESEIFSEEDMTEMCLICDERGKDEDWYMCNGCKRWSHAECSGWTKKEIETTKYQCDFCAHYGKCRKALASVFLKN